MEILFKIVAVIVIPIIVLVLSTIITFCILYTMSDFKIMLNKDKHKKK